MSNTSELRKDMHAATGQQKFATTEYRYWGANPNNYVQFNNELWRIIGVMDVDDGTGNIEKRLKIIRANPIGDYSWNSSANDINLGLGVNEWTQADLMTLLNSGAYYNRTTGTCYNGESNATTSCDFTTTGLTSEAKEMIGNAKWYLGSAPEAYNALTSNDFYTYERGNTTGKECTPDSNVCDDTITRTTSWIGQIGLMYPSDYGYSVDMKNCSTTALTNYHTFCNRFSWLYDNSNFKWTISPSLYHVYATYTLEVSWNGELERAYAYLGRSVFPVTYLKSNIQIIDGIGTDQQPFILSK